MSLSRKRHRPASTRESTAEMHYRFLRICSLDYAAELHAEDRPGHVLGARSQ